MARWLRRGVLGRDERPALYVYQQQRGARILQRGLIGDLLLPRQGDNCCRTKTCRLMWSGSTPPICQGCAPNWRPAAGPRRPRVDDRTARGPHHPPNACRRRPDRTGTDHPHIVGLR
ncbi:hypothetical protein ACH5A2_01565 [Streptomyces collinus]|uniref:hypothetical protein n=1 Tax=Streptomyces collinus TaxID=42684 RepID=UPI0037B27219